MMSSKDVNRAGFEPPRRISLAWLVYGQIAAMLGAFSLLVS